jgi:hypothetical protein
VVDVLAAIHIRDGLQVMVVPVGVAAPGETAPAVNPVGRVTAHWNPVISEEGAVSWNKMRRFILEFV